MNKINCFYCGNEITLHPYVYKTLSLDVNLSSTSNVIDTFVTLHRIVCPNCGVSMLRVSTNSKLYESSLPLIPSSDAKILPDYIPENIRTDYREAFDILYLSPKASATLSRRCLQSVIHDFWNIKEKNINAEISALKTKIEPDIFNALNDLRSIGNIGAHSEYNTSTIIDIEPSEAKQLLLLIELLIEHWYISRHKKQDILQSVSTISKEKQSMQKN